METTKPKAPRWFSGEYDIYHLTEGCFRSRAYFPALKTFGAAPDGARVCKPCAKRWAAAFTLANGGAQ
jgi:hypothetical protein